MDNTMTPRLVELADRSRKFLEQPHTLDIGDVMQLVADMRKALSRLMAEGGLVGAASPSASLELKDLLRRLREPSGIGEPHDHALMREAAEMLAVTDYGYREVCKANDELQALCSALQAERSEGGSSNPVDDGAVERALDAFYGLEWRNAPGPNLLRAEMRAALEAAEPHP